MIMTAKSKSIPTRWRVFAAVAVLVLVQCALTRPGGLVDDRGDYDDALPLAARRRSLAAADPSAATMPDLRSQIDVLRSSLERMVELLAEVSDSDDGGGAAGREVILRAADLVRKVRSVLPMLQAAYGGGRQQEQPQLMQQMQKPPRPPTTQEEESRVLKRDTEGGDLGGASPAIRPPATGSERRHTERVRDRAEKRDLLAAERRRPMMRGVAVVEGGDAGGGEAAADASAGTGTEGGVPVEDADAGRDLFITVSCYDPPSTFIVIVIIRHRV